MVHFSGLVVGMGALVVGLEILILLFSAFYAESDLGFSKPSVTNNVPKDLNSIPSSGIIPPRILTTSLSIGFLFSSTFLSSLYFCLPPSLVSYDETYFPSFPSHLILRAEANQRIWFTESHLREYL